MCFVSARCGYLKHIKGGGPLHFPLSPSPCLLSCSPSSPGPWFQRASSLLLFPVMARDHRLPPLFLFLSLFLVFPKAIQSCSPHTGEAAWQPTTGAALLLHRGMVLSPLVSLRVTVLCIQSNTLSLPFSVSFLAALGGGWRVNRVRVGSSPISLITTQMRETPAFRFRSPALSLVPCVSWPYASPPLPPFLSPRPSSLSISPPPSCCSLKEPE